MSMHLLYSDDYLHVEIVTNCQLTPLSLNAVCTLSPEHESCPFCQLLAASRVCNGHKCHTC